VPDPQGKSLEYKQIFLLEEIPLVYHQPVTLGKHKWDNLGIVYKLEGIDPPTKERVENANRILKW